MQFSEGQVGRVFALRLEHGEPMPETLEGFLAQQGVTCAAAIMVGGADEGSRFVVGPEDGRALPPAPSVNIRGAMRKWGLSPVFSRECGIGTVPILAVPETRAQRQAR